jgi:hypothetical protein
VIFIPILLIAAGTAVVLAVVLTQEVVPDHPPDLPMPFLPGSTGYKRIDAIMDRLPDGAPGLRTAASTSGIPLGLLVGWIARESGGKIGETTKLDERGYFQLHPDESKSLGLDHQRLSTDPQYSINAGLKLIGLKYMPFADKFNIFPKGSSDYWKLVKLGHTMGSGAAAIVVNDARAAGATGSWAALEKYALDHNSELFSKAKHSPAKWFPLVDAVATAGAPFGFGSSSTAVVGEAAFTDIPDILNLLPKYKQRS